MVTVQDLKDWSDENGEDVIFDGPYMYNMTQYNELTKNLSDELVKEFGPAAKITDMEETFDWYDITPPGFNPEKAYDILLQCFADLINKYNLQKSW